MKGAAGDALLDSYEIERQPIARINNEQSLNNAMKMFDLIVAIHGLDPEKPLSDMLQSPRARRRFRSWLKLLRRKSLTLIVSICKLATATTVRQLLIQLPFLTCQMSDYQPSWDAGAHFPHRWVTHGGVVQPLQGRYRPVLLRRYCMPRFRSVSGAHPNKSADFRVDFQDEDSWQDQTGL